MEVWYCNIENVSESDFHKLLEQCPPKEQEDILRYRFLKDRLFRLLGHRMVMMKYGVNFADFNRSQTGKPFLISGEKFNISHAGNIVTVAFSEREVGIDIETMLQINIDDIANFFHSEERKELAKLNGSEQLKLFYRIWTRKEAFLKAVGQGIMNGLDEFDCLKDQVVFDGEMWNITSLKEINNYALAICSPLEVEVFEFRKVDPFLVRVPQKNGSNLD